MSDTECCVYCDLPLAGDDLRFTIYVRAMVDGRWQSAACCTPCWNERNADRQAFRYIRPKEETDAGS